MDAAEIARLREDAKRRIGLEYLNQHGRDVLALIDALEQAQKERDEWQAAMIDWTGPEATKALLAERDQAQKDAKDARALLAEAAGWVFPHDGPLRARIEAVLKPEETAS